MAAGSPAPSIVRMKLFTLDDRLVETPRKPHSHWCLVLDDVGAQSSPRRYAPAP